MAHRQYHRNTKILWGLILAASVYIAWFYRLQTLTGLNLLDGVIGVLLGLYICSHPAANAIDLIYFERSALRQATSEWSSAGWLALNLLALLLGWIVIVIAATRFAGNHVAARSLGL